MYIISNNEDVNIAISSGEGGEIEIISVRGDGIRVENLLFQNIADSQIDEMMSNGGVPIGQEQYALLFDLACDRSTSIELRKTNLINLINSFR